MIRFRPLLFMTLLAGLALFGLLLLGRWQWERYEQKRAAASEPVAQMTIANYEPLPEGLQLVHGIRNGQEGWRVFAPVRNGEEVVFVDCDFVSGPTTPNWHEIRLCGALRFNAPVQGASIRPGPPAPLAPAPNPLARAWFDVDLDAMGRTAGLEHVADYYVAAAYVGADGRAAPNPFALPAGVDPLPPERHLGYALTWWGLAAVLIVIYFAYHVSVGRLKFVMPKPHD